MRWFGDTYLGSSVISDGTFGSASGQSASEPTFSLALEVVPPFFSHLLPAGPLRRHLADRAGVKQTREFFLLWMLGRDLPGAVTLHPSEGDDVPPDDERADVEARPNALRFSLAGVQLKFSAFKNDGRGGLPLP